MSTVTHLFHPPIYLTMVPSEVIKTIIIIMIDNLLKQAAVALRSIAKSVHNDHKHKK